MVTYSAGGNLTVKNASLSYLVQEVYGVRVFQITGEPGWFNSDRFDISAKADSNANKEQMQAMAQRLLADRFQLKLHRVTKDFTVYLLIVGSKGSKLKDAADPGDPANSGIRLRGTGYLTGMAASTGQLAVALSDMRLNGQALLDRPVLDRTGLKGVYDFGLRWAPDGVPDSDYPSIFTAVQEQLGLKLDQQRASIEAIVIDSVSRPSAN